MIKSAMTRASSPARGGACAPLLLNQQDVMPVGIAYNCAFGKCRFVLRTDYAGRNETHVCVAQFLRKEIDVVCLNYRLPMDDIVRVNVCGPWSAVPWRKIFEKLYTRT